LISVALFTQWTDYKKGATDMNTLRSEKFTDSKPKTSKITTTLYDLLDSINANLRGPQYTDKVPIQDDKFDLAALTVEQMFDSGQIKFKNPQKIIGYFNDSYLLNEI
jgi:hypothetical protein